MVFEPKNFVVMLEESMFLLVLLVVLRLRSWDGLV
jgi:hypothetical protein